MSQHTVAPLTVLDPHTQAARQLTFLTDALAEDLDQGVWVPGPLERSLVSRLLTSCAGDGQFTGVRLRETMWEGSVALTYAGDGRLVRLLAQLCEVTEHPAPAAQPALSAALRLLERSVQGVSVGGDKL
jgi:hypothetical protein